MPIISRKMFSEICGDDILKINKWIQRGKISTTAINKKLIDTENPLNSAFITDRRRFNDMPVFDGFFPEISKIVLKVAKNEPEKAKTVQKLPETVTKIPKKVTESLEKSRNKTEIIADLPVKEAKKVTKKAEKTFHVEPKQVRSHQVKLDKALLEQNARDQLRVDLAYQLQQKQFEKAELDIQHKKLLLDKAAGELLPVDLVRGVLSRNGSSFVKAFEQGIENIATIMCEVMAAGDPTMRPRIIGEMKVLLSKCIQDAGGMAEREVATLVDDYSQTNYRGQKKI